jgi:acetylglutamate kinase
VLDAGGRTIGELDRQAAGALIASGTASAGMVAKLRACTEALEHGAGEVLLVNGRLAPAIEAALSGPSEQAAAFGFTRMVA